jgi:predicted nucleotidyltransferase
MVTRSASLNQQLKHLQDAAQQLASSFPAIEAVCLYGSVARGDSNQSSDVDLLVIGLDATIRNSQLRACLSGALLRENVSLSYLTLRQFSRLVQSGVSFILHLQLEGELIFDRRGAVNAILTQPLAHDPGVDKEMQFHLRRLHPLEDLTQFGGLFSLAFAQLYSIGKSVIMLRLATEGCPEFNRRHAFAKFRSRHPELAHEIRAIRTLEPFYESAFRSRHKPLAVPAPSDARRMESVLAAIRSIGVIHET